MASHGKQAGSPSAAALEDAGNLAHPSEPNAIFAIHSKPEYKLEDNGRNAQLIKTVRSGGYVLAAPVERA